MRDPLKLALVVVLMAAPAFAATLHGFEISECRGRLCIEASGREAAIAITDGGLSAKNVRLSLVGVTAPVVHECVEFRFDLRSKFLVCDNRSAGGGAITIDEKARVARF